MWNYFFHRNWAEDQKDQEKPGSRKKEIYCMMSSLEEQLYVGCHALFDLETI